MFKDWEKLFSWNYLSSLMLVFGWVRKLAICDLLRIEVISTIHDLIKDLFLLLKIFNNCLSLYLLITLCRLLVGFRINIEDRLFVELFYRYVHFLVHLQNLFVHSYFLFSFNYCSIVELNWILLKISFSTDNEAWFKVNERTGCWHEH